VERCNDFDRGDVLIREVLEATFIEVLGEIGAFSIDLFLLRELQTSLQIKHPKQQCINSLELPSLPFLHSKTLQLPFPPHLAFPTFSSLASQRQTLILMYFKTSANSATKLSFDSTSELIA
jgi:hypothetical protein